MRLFNFFFLEEYYQVFSNWTSHKQGKEQYDYDQKGRMGNGEKANYFPPKTTNSKIPNRRPLQFFIWINKVAC